MQHEYDVMKKMIELAKEAESGDAEAIDKIGVLTKQETVRVLDQVVDLAEKMRSSYLLGDLNTSIGSAIILSPKVQALTQSLTVQATLSI